MSQCSVEMKIESTSVLRVTQSSGFAPVISVTSAVLGTPFYKREGETKPTMEQ